MYSIIATNDFVDLIKDLPLKCTAVLTSSFVSIRKVDEINDSKNTFIGDLLEQIKNQELE